MGIIGGIRQILLLIQGWQHAFVVYHIQIELEVVERLVFLFVSRERFRDLIRLAKVKYLDALVGSLCLRLVLLQNFGRLHVKAEVGLRVDGPVFLLFLCLCRVIGSHVLHLLVHIALILFRVSCRHLVQHLPVAFHLFLDLWVSTRHRIHHCLHGAHLCGVHLRCTIAAFSHPAHHLHHHVHIHAFVFCARKI